MNDDDILSLTSKIESTLGAENFAMISDTVGEILTGNTLNMQALADRDKEISILKERNEKLVSANGALLQKLPMSKEIETKEKKEEEVQKTISWKDVFDKKGNFIR